jgi:hypothetical protein
VVGTQYSDLLFSPKSASSAVDSDALNLSATRVDDNILVKWDRQSSAVRNGLTGKLTITEGPDSKIVQMDGTQLRNGTVLYRHVAQEIAFKLEVALKERRIVEETTIWRMPSNAAK